MRKAMVAKLSLTAAVGLGTLFHAGTAQAQPPKLDQTGDIKWAPTPPTTIGPIIAYPVDPDPEPDPPFDPDLPIAQPEDDGCDNPCDLAPAPQPDPQPECNPHALCDEITSDPGCTWTHGCPEEDPECPPISCDLTSDGGTDDGGTDGGPDDGGDESTTGGDEGTTGGETGGGSGGGHLPRTGGEIATWAIAGLGLTGVGAGLRKLGKGAQQ